MNTLRFLLGRIDSDFVLFGVSGVWNRQENGFVSVKPQISLGPLTDVVQIVSAGVSTTMLLTLVVQKWRVGSPKSVVQIVRRGLPTTTSTSRSAVVFQGYVAAYQSRYRSLMDIPSQASAKLSEAKRLEFLYEPP